MAEVELGCAVYGEGTVFPVKIARDAKVSALQKAIFNDQRYRERFSFPASALTLYLAKKSGETTWLVDDDNLDSLLQGGVDKQYTKMRSLWVLDENYFGKNFEPGRKEIHVLVELPSPVASLFEELPTQNPSPANKRLRVGVEPRIEKFEDVPRINIQGVQYVTLPAALLEKCGYKASSVILYCRHQVRDLWRFVQEEVLVKNGKGYIVGPPGTGKSVSTLSYVASLDHEEWNAVWIHLGNMRNSCLALGSKKYWLLGDLLTFDLPRVSNRKLFICVDGYKALDAHKAFVSRIYACLLEADRLLVCSSMATLGKINQEDAAAENTRLFFMYSWTHDEYVQAIADQTFYDDIVSRLDATSSNEVNEDDGVEAEWSEEDKKKHALDLKFYYAGGSCRFMFGYQTHDVINTLKGGVQSVANKSDLIRYCAGDLHTDTINRLYGMQRDGDKTVRFPVSSYVASLFAKECDEKKIVELANRLNESNNPSVDGHLFEWLFLASVPKRAVKLFGDRRVEEVLPQANVLRFDPKKRFKVRNGRIKGDQSWLQPTVWNQGGYDAVYFDKDEGKVIFVQVTRSDKHDFKMRFFYEILHKLRSARMEIKQVVVYFVVKPAQYMNFKIDHIEDRGVLFEFDASWTRPEESHVRVRTFEAAPVS